MIRPDTIHLRHTDAETIEQLIEAVGVGAEGSTIELLDRELDRAVIVSDDAFPENTVALGSRVRFEDRQTGKEREVMLVVPSKAASEKGRVSVLSPVGSALIGLRVADEIDWPMAGGRVHRLRVVAVSNGD